MQHFHSRDAGQTQDPCSEDPAPVLPMEATDEVVRYYSPMVRRLALTKTQSAQDAEDISRRYSCGCAQIKRPLPPRSIARRG